MNKLWFIYLVTLTILRVSAECPPQCPSILRIYVECLPQCPLILSLSAEGPPQCPSILSVSTEYPPQCPSIMSLSAECSPQCLTNSHSKVFFLGPFKIFLWGGVSFNLYVYITVHHWRKLAVCNYFKIKINEQMRNPYNKFKYCSNYLISPKLYQLYQSKCCKY